MLVYCANFHFEKSTTSVENVLETILEWINSKSGLEIQLVDILESEREFWNRGIKITSILSVFDGNILGFAIKLMHGDSLVSGRQWIVEMGCKSGPESIHCSILLETSEISTRVQADLKPSTPKVVELLLNKYDLKEHSPGKKVIHIDNAQITYLNYVLTDPNRTFPIILISHNEGSYYFDYNRLTKLLGGIAEVLVIKPETNTYQISELIGDRYNAWGGAINIIYPPNDGNINSYIIYPKEVQSLKNGRVDICLEIFSIVTHRTNFYNLREHISSFSIKELNYKQQIDTRALLDLSKESDRIEYEKIVEEEIASKTDRINELDLKITEYQLLYEEADSLSNQYKHKSELLESQIAEIKANENVVFEENQLIDLFHLTTKDKIVPEKILKVLAICFSDKVFILEDAYKSSKDSDQFRELDKFSALLLKLVIDYRNLLLVGKPDSEARKVLGSAYSAKESETTTQNKSARSKREFIYQGEKLLMEKHLRIGVKDTPVETIRVHFHWDAKSKKIIIGYCGPHLKLVGK